MIKMNLFVCLKISTYIRLVRKKDNTFSIYTRRELCRIKSTIVLGSKNKSLNEGNTF